MTVTAAAAPQAKRRVRLPLIAALALAFVSLALISGVAYIVVLAGATGTAERLLVDRAQRVVDEQVATVKSRLDPVTEQLGLVAALLAAGRIDIQSPVAVRESLAVMMTKVPGVSAVAFASLDLQLHRALRQPNGMVIRDTIPLVDSPRGMERFRQLQTAHSTFWGELFWNNELRQPLLNVRTPVRRIDDAFVGGLIATVAVGDLSYLISEAGQSGSKLTARLVPIAARAVVDMSGVGFVGSMGVGMFISCAKALAKKNGKLVLFAAQPAVQQVLEVAGLNSITPIVADIDAALAAALA